jgi:hypothetical protein
MLTQAAWGLSGVVAGTDGALALTGRPEEVGRILDPFRIDDEPWVGLRIFLDHVRGRTQPVKIQMTGPVTLGRALHVAGVDVDRAFAVAGATVRARAVELVTSVRLLLPDAPLLVMLDEPVPDRVRADPRSADGSCRGPRELDRPGVDRRPLLWGGRLVDGARGRS